MTTAAVAVALLEATRTATLVEVLEADIILGLLVELASVQSIKIHIATIPGKETTEALAMFQLQGYKEIINAN
jgi:hypothetical protein